MAPFCSAALVYFYSALDSLYWKRKTLFSGTRRLAQGTTLKLDGQSYVLLRKLNDADWQLEEEATKRIITLPMDEMLSCLNNGRLTLTTSATVIRRGPADCDLTGQELETASIKRLYVLAVQDVPNTRPAMEAAITKVWLQAKVPSKLPSYTAVYGWKRRFLAAGGDIRALLDNHRAKGNRENRYDDRVMSLCRESIDARYMTRERRTIQDATDEALYRVVQENKLRPATMALQLPTRRLIKRIIDAIPAEDRITARYGKTYARRHFRSVKGHVVVEFPLERAEIDHTPLDLFVLDDATLLPLGRPWITVCIDVYTRCILGICISFTPPSFRTVAGCLKDCFRPKIDLRAQYPDIKSDWPSFGVMRELVVDGGLEFVGNSLSQVCLSLNITIVQSPVRQPWFKPHVERFVGSLNGGLSANLRGKTFSSIFAKGDYDPQKDAIVTMSAIQVAIRKWIADVYHNQFHRGIDTTPAKLWRSTVKNEDILLPDASTDLDAVMGRSYSRTLTHKGIEFEGLFYNSPELSQVRRRHGASVKVELRVDETDLGSLYVLSPWDSTILKVPCLAPEYASGISLYQHELFKRRQQEIRGADATTHGWLEAKKDIQLLVENAMSNRTKGIGKRAARFLDDSRGNSLRPRRQSTVPTPAPADKLNRDAKLTLALDAKQSQEAVVTSTTAAPRIQRQELTPIVRKESQLG